MATIKYALDRARFVKLVAQLKDMGFLFISGNIEATPTEITRDRTFCSSADYPHNNGYFFLFPKFIHCEIFETKEIDNIHQGRVFAVSRAAGGPYMELWFRIDQAGIFSGDIELRSRFVLSDYTIIAPPLRLKEFFNQVRKLVRSEMKAMTKG